MNKTLVTVGLIFLVVQYVACAPKHEDNGKHFGSRKSNEDSHAEKKELANFLNLDKVLVKNVEVVLKQIADKCPEIEKKFNETVLEARKCENELKIGSNTICTIIKTSITKCLTPLRDLVSNCVPAESKELPLLFEKGLLGVVKQACDSTLEEILELMNPCQSKKNWSEVSSCTELRNAVKPLERKFPTKEIICSLFPLGRQCAKDVFSAGCKNPITINTYVKFYKSVEDETEEVCHNSKKNEVV